VDTESASGVVVERRRGVGVGLVAGLSLDLSLDLAEVLLQLPEIVVRQEAGTPVHGWFTPRGYRCTCDDQGESRTPP